VIAYKTEDEVPQYSVTIRKWNLKAKVPEQIFRFAPPEGARRVEVAALRPAFGPQTGTAETQGRKP
jgi:hypothetical protein